MNDLDSMEWQLVGDDDWIFGVKLRGVVRYPLAEIYYNEDSNDPRGGWVWMLRGGGKPVYYPLPRGMAGSRGHALEEAEEALKVKYHPNGETNFS